MAILFLTAVTLLFVHEIDAMRRREWRFLPLLRTLPDKSGETIFILIHIPMFAGMIWLGWLVDGAWQGMARIAISGFCLVHVGLHVAFSRHPHYAFHGPLSNGLIWGSGVFGGAYLLALMAG